MDPAGRGAADLAAWSRASPTSAWRSWPRRTASETRSGVPLGSPPYMAPEQAAGRLRDVGPATDVYALGATLYEVLTGRAPFRGETPAETIRQVIEHDPIAPRVLRPDVPARPGDDLPALPEQGRRRRYPSAAALAEDLERFLAGRPIQARPASAGSGC